MWRPDIGKYTGHMQRAAAPGAQALADASCNVIPQFVPLMARTLGPGLRAWQADPFNKDASYAAGYDAMVCATALTNAVGAPWITRPSPTTELGVSTPVLNGVVPTNQAGSTDCGDRCAWISKDMQATAIVSAGWGPPGLGARPAAAWKAGPRPGSCGLAGSRRAADALAGGRSAPRSMQRRRPCPSSPRATRLRTPPRPRPSHPPPPKQDIEFAFEKERMHEWFADIKRLIAKDLKGLPGMGASQRCLTPGYYVMRFGKAADSHVGMAAHIKEPIYVQVGGAGGRGAGAVRIAGVGLKPPWGVPRRPPLGVSGTSAALGQDGSWLGRQKQEGPALRNEARL
jgi:hypothetical protein